MRNLQASDIFVFARVLNKIGIKDEVKNMVLKASNVKEIVENQDELGFDFLFAIFEKATGEKAEKELFKFFAGIMEIETEEAMKMDPCDFIDAILEMAEPEKWKAFFTRVAKLIQSN
jgi:hypothetical protein